MKLVVPLILFVIAVFEITGCASSARFKRIPDSLDTVIVKKQSIAVMARRFSFDPEEIRVKKGTLVTLKITARDTDHGFRLSDFGVDERLPQGETVTIQFYAAEAGSHSFVCSNFCGLGHPWMNGRIVIIE